LNLSPDTIRPEYYRRSSFLDNHASWSLDNVINNI
jgi:hypothetical protein